MRIVLSWLREIVPVELDAEKLGDLLARKGMHPESIERPWDGLDGVVVARVLEVRDHPGSETLCLARVQTGSGEQEIVVGVRNFSEGDLVPLAGPGARVPGLPDPLAARTIRGVVSNGMLCSPRELGISADHGGILLLNDLALDVGADLKMALGLDEAVLDLEIESNRPDLLSVVGVAREVGAALALPLRLPDTSVEETDEDAETVATVEVKDPEGCPRYLARVVRGLGHRTTPLRMQARLTAAGMRPISAAVDATNYVMLELGQPLHAFDLALLRGPGIVVRRAEPGERLTTLDDEERELVADDLLICDVERPVAIAGVMGGTSSEMSDETTDVLLESAYFEPRGVLRTSRRLRLLSEAATRFSRGTDPEGVGPAAARASRLMVEWSGGGAVLRGAIDVGAPPPRRTISLRPARATELLGYPVDADRASGALATLGITATEHGGTLEVDVPSHRPDLVAEVDLIEEIARVDGYDGLPSTVPPIRGRGGEMTSYARRRRVRKLLVRAGLREVSSLSFASARDLELFHSGPGVVVANPPSAEEPFLRRSLLPALATTVARNGDLGARTVALFEVGHVFAPGDPVDEREVVACAMWGAAGVGLHGDPRELDVLDAKAALEVVLRGLGVSWQLGDARAAPFHPGRSSDLVAAGRTLGVLGELHPTVAGVFGAVGRVAVFEFDLESAAAAADRSFAIRDVPRFPPVRRDLAFIVASGVPAGYLRTAIEEAGAPLVDRCVLFDVFEGGSLPEGTKSLAFSIDLRAPDRTLTDEEAAGTVERVVDALAKGFGARLRTG